MTQNVSLQTAAHAGLQPIGTPNHFARTGIEILYAEEWYSFSCDTLRGFETSILAPWVDGECLWKSTFHKQSADAVTTAVQPAEKLM